jgi:hypothetical protein
VSELKARLSKMRLFQFAMIASVLMFVRMGEMFRHPGSSGWTLWHWVVAGIAIGTVYAGSTIRRRVLARAEMTLVKDASDLKALRQWESGQVLGMAFAESLGLWGLDVRLVLGGALWQASLFYSAGLILLLVWTPRLPNELTAR